MWLSIAVFFGFAEPPVEPVVEVVEVVESIVEDGVSVPASETLLENVVEESVAEVLDSPTEEVVIEESEMMPTDETFSTTPNIRTMMVAGGCFWCVEADLEKVPGVIDVVSGYAGGTSENPTYKNYVAGGHREVVEVTYDANKVSFEDILIVTLKTTDPTDDDGTFGDRGDEYSAAFYYSDAMQKKIINDLIVEVDEFGPYDEPLAIDVEALSKFWRAESYHQDYYKGTLSKLKYQYYRTGSGRTAFIEKYWGVNDHSPKLSWRENNTVSNNKTYMWSDYQKPSEDVLKSQLDSLTFKVTQKNGTERGGSSPLDKIYDDGVFVDVLSGEPLYSSKDKFDSGTGWPSFTRPIVDGAVVERDDRKLFVTRTEIRSVIGDNHIGHVFTDGPKDSTGLRYCMNGAALRFVPKADMEAEGYGDFLRYI